MIDNLIQRAQILLEQNRYEEANKILTDLLAKEPNNYHLLSICSEVALQLGDTKKAEGLINSAISHAPDVDYLYYVKSRVMLQLEKYDDAESCLMEATAMNPNNADYFALLGNIKLSRKKFQDALDMANKALELDAENILGLNTRSSALLKLNKKEESFKTIEGALKEDPNNAYTHANYGWSLLEKGDPTKALKHFKEALKNDPNFSYAQAGMMEALKAKYLLYRLFLKYAFWMSNLTAKYQWGVILGFYFASRALDSAATRFPVLEPFITPILIIMAIFAFSTWVIQPISNLFLRLNVYGKHLLSKKQILSSNFVGVSAIVFIASLLAYVFSGELKWVVSAAFGFAMMVPFSVMFSPTKYKYSLLIYTGLMFLIGSTAVYETFRSGAVFNQFSNYFLFGFVGFQFVANYLLIRADNR